MSIRFVASEDSLVSVLASIDAELGGALPPACPLQRGDLVHVKAGLPMYVRVTERVLVRLPSGERAWRLLVESAPSPFGQTQPEPPPA